MHAWAKESATGMPATAERLRMESKSHKLRDGSVDDFLASLPRVESHYCRSTPARSI